MLFTTERFVLTMCPMSCILHIKPAEINDDACLKSRKVLPSNSSIPLRAEIREFAASGSEARKSNPAD